MSRPTRESTWLGVAALMAGRSTCCRLQVGCVLVDARGHALSTGYNGRASGLVHCNEMVKALGVEEPTANPFWREQGGRATQRPVLETYPHRCENSNAPSGRPNGCEAIHAEQNALLQCKDVYAIHTCYCTHSPCLTCVKLLMNTSCLEIVFREEYPHPDAERLWSSSRSGNSLRVWTRAT